LKDGQTLESKDEPDYDAKAGFYEFEDLRGKHIRVNKDDIVKMEAE
jgi:hypothetical protein